jgi:hypothetical protein
MILPDDTCAVTANRCQCRLVPNEKLVNTAGHTPGTSAVESINGDALKLNKKEQLDQAADKVAEACPLPWKTESTIDN